MSSTVDVGFGTVHFGVCGSGCLLVAFSDRGDAWEVLLRPARDTGAVKHDEANSAWNWLGAFGASWF